MYEYRTLEELRTLAKSHGVRLHDITLRHEAEVSEASEASLLKKMEARIEVFRESIEAGLHDAAPSRSGLTGGDAVKLAQKKATLLGPIAQKAQMYALATSEANAKMFRIVACPTAGACGIVPGVMAALIEEKHVTREAATLALFTGAAIGEVIARSASIAGAVGGCQAECGTAAAMAAAIATELAGGTDEEALEAMALAMKNTLGLTCDPVAGLVEVPCVKRNAALAVLAVGAAQMALAGIKSFIPPDEVIAAMAAIGRAMPVSLKETSEGGLAKTPTAQATAKRLQQEMNQA